MEKTAIAVAVISCILLVVQSLRAASWRDGYMRIEEYKRNQIRHTQTRIAELQSRIALLDRIEKTRIAIEERECAVRYLAQAKQKLETLQDIPT